MTSGAASRRIYIVGIVLLVVVVAGVVAFSAITFLWNAAMAEQRERLLEHARSQARLLEAIANNEAAEGAPVSQAVAFALEQVAEALDRYQPAAASGEFQIARRDGDLIVFLVRQRRGEGSVPAPVPFGGTLAVPMQRALSGESGTVVGADYAGVRVLAGYEPTSLGLGVVAKVDLAEIRAPFRSAALLALGPTLGAALLGGGLLLISNRPLLRRSRQAELQYDELVRTMGEGFAVLDEKARFIYVNDRQCEIFGRPRGELLGKYAGDFHSIESRAALAEVLARRRQGESTTHESVIVRPNGARRRVRIAGRPRHAQGKFVGSFAVATDVTDHQEAVDELRRQKELAQNYLDIAGTILVVLDSEGKIELINRRGVAALGFDDARDLIGREWFATCLPEDVRDEVRRVFAQIMAGDLAPVEMYENQIVRRDGARRLILWHNTISRDAKGSIQRTLSSGEDITESRRQSERLAHLNAVLRAVRNVNQLITREKDRDRLLEEGCRELVATEGIRHAWVAELDAGGRVVRAAEAGIGPAFAPLRQRLLDGFLPVCCREAVAQGGPFVLVELPAECADCPAQIVHPDAAAVAVPMVHGRRTHGVLVAAVPRAWADDPEELSLLVEVAGDLAFALHSLDESDARRAAEAAQRESAAQYRSLFENAVLGVYLTTPRGDIVAANPALISMLGYDSFEDLARRNLEEAGFHPEYSRAAFKKRIDRDGRVVGLEAAWARKDGSTIHVRENAVAVRDDGGRILFYEGTVEDITARHDAERARLDFEARLRQAQKLESIGTLASGIAHEINNPLTGMINYGQLILERTEKEALREFARGIVEEGNRVAAIVRSLLEFSRQQRESHSPARMADIVAATLALTRAALQKDGIDVRVDVSEDLPVVICRSHQIQQVLLNLLTNARDALNARYSGFDEGKWVRIAASSVERETGAWVRVVVEDSGTGIAPEIVDRVFDPFFTTKSRDQGTGLGLSISYGIVRDHRGTLSVESRPGEPTRFVMELPVDAARAQPETRPDRKES